MASLEDLFQSVSADLGGLVGNNTDYVSLLERRGFRTPNAILAAGSSERLQTACNLMPGEAMVIWKAANEMAAAVNKTAATAKDTPGKPSLCEPQKAGMLCSPAVHLPLHSRACTHTMIIAASPARIGVSLFACAKLPKITNTQNFPLGSRA